ncbi:MAG: hypothetical protein KA270_13595 [Saprospiraceae bacterium]|nr:hypothetical protein [Saprospiraceae bacterium]MBP6568200.1 hypothetical protein [Saprospiraceae bacterium]
METIRPIAIFILFHLFLANVSLATETSKVRWQVVPDSNYTIDQIVQQDYFSFQHFDTIYPQRHSQYWVRVSIHNPEGDNFYLSASPNINNKWYFQVSDGRWKKISTGLMVPSDTRDHRFKAVGIISDSLICYIHMDVRKMDNIASFLPTIKVINETIRDSKEKYILLFSTISAIILLIYIVNFLIDYYMLKESTHVYYLMVLIGGLMYVVSYHSVIDLIINLRFVKVIDASLTQIYSADISYIINRLSIMIIFFGIIQLSNTFLDLKNALPLWNKILDYYAYFFVGINGLSLTITLLTSFPADMYLISISNIMLILAMILVLIGGIFCLKKDKNNAILFLTGHLVPFLLIIVTSVIVEIYAFEKTIAYTIIPYLSVLSLPMSLSIVLAIRVRNVKNALTKNMLYTQQLGIENERMRYDKEIENLENENIKNQLELEKMHRENLELKIDLQNRQLLTSAMQNQKKDTIIHHISQEVSKISKNEEASSAAPLKAIRLLMLNLKTAEANWQSFKEHFEKIHPDFFEKLKREYPELTPNEVRLSAYLQLNLTNKEIAVLQNIEPSSVKRAKIRLKQKLNKSENS